MREAIWISIIWIGIAFTQCVSPSANSKTGEVVLAPGLVTKLSPEIVEVVDPSESKPKKPAKVSYMAYEGNAFLDTVFGDRESWKKSGLIGFQCADGYVAMIPTKDFADGEFYFAVARVGSEDFSLIKHATDGKKTNLAPYYLIWKKLPKTAEAQGHYWPYQVISLQLL